jgi:tetratricopeptide (TPR) repeat protein
MTRRTRWLCIILLILCVSTALVHQYRGRDRDIWRAHEAQGAFRERPMEVLTADAVTAVRTAHEVLAQERWTEAAALTPAGEIAGCHVPLVWAVTYFARAVGAARMGQTVRARQDLEELRLLRNGLVVTRQGDWATHVELLSQVAAAWVAQREGQHTEAVQHLHAAADLEDRRAPHPVMLELIASADELLGEMLLERGECARAVRVFETAIETAPQRGTALYRAARAAELADDLAKARGFYARLLGRVPMQRQTTACSWRRLGHFWRISRSSCLSKAGVPPSVPVCAPELLGTNGAPSCWHGTRVHPCTRQERRGYPCLDESGCAQSRESPSASFGATSIAH